MNLKRTLLAAAILLPFIAEAIPSIVIISPKSSANLTNGILTASGTAKSTVPLAGVFYSFNGTDFLPASGTTNWGVTNLALVPGPNTFMAYAMDRNNICSKTNKVIFTYVVNAPITILTEGRGHVSPDYSAKQLQITKKYVMNAAGTGGFKFKEWWLNDVWLTNSSHITFIMASNLTYKAVFVDAQKPICAVTYPAAKHTVSNSPLTAVCRTKDNVGVTAVWYQLNTDDWKSDATSNDGGTNWNIANLALSIGQNTLKVCAADAAGNFSKTNSILFTYASNAPPDLPGFAPESLAGLEGTISGEQDDSGSNLPPFQISFGLSTFAISSTDTNVSAKVGNYTYTILDSNTIQVAIVSIAPPNEAGGKSPRVFTFTNSTTCLATNDLGNQVALTFAPVSKLVPSPSALLTMGYSDASSGQTGTIVLGGGVFTNYADDGSGGQIVNGWGTSYLEQFSPVAALMVQVYGDQSGSAYTALRFTNSVGGTWFTTSLDSQGAEEFVGTGDFGILSSSNPPAGTAPASLAGKTVSVSPPGEPSFKITFGDCAYSMFDTSTDTNKLNTSVGDYTFVKIDANTAQLTMTSVAPWSDSITNMDTVVLSFSTSSSGKAVNKNNTPFTVSAASDIAPDSLAGKTLITNDGHWATFNNDGTLTDKDGIRSYTYTKYSATGGMLIWTGSDNTHYIQLQFTKVSGGSYFATNISLDGSLGSVGTGTFSVK